MSLSDGPFLSNASDLIFYLDASNTRSYPGSGTIWYDLTANGNNFTLYNSPTFVRNGTTGTYFTFNGTNQYLRSTNAINFNNYSAVTIEFGFRQYPNAVIGNAIVATGGGGGGGQSNVASIDRGGNDGGSGGGSTRNANSTTGNLGQFTPVEGYGGGASGLYAGTQATGGDWGAGGGGGSSGRGENAQLVNVPRQSGKGGTGTLLSITGTPTYYAGGGGGGGSSYQSVAGGVGTINTGGGGAGSSSGVGGSATAYTGGGGGGGYSGYDGGPGGAGTVIVAYYSPTQAGLGGTVTTAAGNKWIHTFTTNSSFTATNTTSIELLVVAGGGGGGASNITYHGGGGGGAGGLRYFNTLTVSTAGYYQIIVGLGGPGGTAAAGTTGTNGGNSLFVPMITTSSQVLFETSGTLGTTVTGGISIIANDNGVLPIETVFLSQWQGFGVRTVSFVPTTNTVFNSIVQIFTKANDATGRQSYVNGSVLTYFTNTSILNTGTTTTSGLTFANTWTYIGSRAGISNFFLGDITYIRAWGRKITTFESTVNSSPRQVTQPGSYTGGTLAVSDPTIPQTGGVAYVTPGTYSWLAPAGVTSVSVVAVGAGQGCGTGGALAYKNNISVVPGTSYTVIVGAAGTGGTNGTPGGDGGFSSFTAAFGTMTAGGGSKNLVGTRSGVYDGGGNGGSSYNNGGGMGGYNGGGAGGYSGDGGAGYIGSWGAGAGGGGAGGNWAYDPGGGVGLYGEGPSGASPAAGGSGGQGGYSGGRYGGGGAPNYNAGTGAPGAVRIIWPGNTRQFPNTSTNMLGAINEITI